MIVGRGRPGQQRYEFVRAAGCERIVLFAVDQDGWACHAEALVHERMPEPADFLEARIVFIAGMPIEISSELASQARAAGALVNVEDITELCEFHVPAVVRREDLLIAVSTGGKAPGLAQVLKRFLETIIGAEWGARVQLIADARTRWRREGVPKEEIVRQTSELIDRENWLPRQAT